MSDMIECVASAMALARRNAQAAHNRELAARGLWQDHVWEPDLSLLARAAIEAMREPSPEMRDASVSDRPPDYTLEGSQWREEVARTTARYRAMIEAALR